MPYYFPGEATLLKGSDKVKYLEREGGQGKGKGKMMDLYDPILYTGTRGQGEVFAFVAM